MLVSRYQRQSVSVTYRFLSNVEDAQDAAQDGFVRAYQSLEQLSDPERFGPWLMRIMVNTALNFRRKRGREPKVSLDVGSESGDGAPVDRLTGHEPSAQERLTAQELGEALETAIEELPEKLRAPLVLFTVEKMAQKEIAEVLDCSVETVKWSVFEARRRLRLRLRHML